jgi:cystathionine gamma-synthase
VADELAFETRVVHVGGEPDELTGAVSPPIYQTSTFAQDGIGRPRGGWEYARTGNPTRSRLESAVADLEGGAFGIAFASGSAVTATIGALALPGDEVIVGDDVYGGTFRWFDKVARPMGVEAQFVDLATDPAAALAATLTDRTRLVWLETPTNPLLRVIDIAAVAKAVAKGVAKPARGKGKAAGVAAPSPRGNGSSAGSGGGSGAGSGAGSGDAARRPLVVVDNTFASPALQRPLELGADIVYHSATKYLGGHSDTLAGVAVTNDPDVAERLHFLQNASGAVPGPQDCFLVLRGLRTLALRMSRHCENALAVARFLASRGDVDTVTYPGLTEGPHAHPAAALAARQMGLGGGMVGFIPAARGSHSARERAIAVCETTRIFTLAESLGGVESLIELPSVMTHASVADSALAVPEAFVRLSVGIESAADLIEDLRQALDRA